MGRIIYLMSVSLDGFVEARDRGIEWTVPAEDLHRYLNEQVRQMSCLLYGRRTYQLMAAFWPTERAARSPVEHIAGFARIWPDKPKVVFSSTLARVEWNSRLVRGDLAREAEVLKQQYADDMGICGPGLASAFIRLGLIDEYQVAVRPIVLGGGTPFFPPLEQPLPLRLIDTRPFDEGVVLLRYAPLPGSSALPTRAGAALS